MQRGILVGSVLSVVVACSVLPNHANDGDACTKSDDCDSKRCESGYCGRDCASDHDSCHEGWTCESFQTTDFILFGGDTVWHCVPHCGACPSSTYCPTEENPSHECILKPETPIVRITDPGPIPSGVPATIKASIEIAKYPVVKYLWTWGDGSPPTETTTPEVTHTFLTAPEGQVDLQVTDAHGGTGNAPRLQLHQIACGKEGAQCAPVQANGCCDEGLNCVGTCQRLTPMTVSLEGPSEVAVNQPFTLGLAVQNAHGRVTSVTWTEQGGLFPKSTTTQTLSTTFTFSNDDYPTMTVVAVATDDLARTAQASKDITVCAPKDADCRGSSSPFSQLGCCAGLHCTTDTFPKCVPN